MFIVFFMCVCFVGRPCLLAGVSWLSLVSLCGYAFWCSLLVLLIGFSFFVYRCFGAPFEEHGIAWLLTA